MSSWFSSWCQRYVLCNCVRRSLLMQSNGHHQTTYKRAENNAPPEQSSKGSTVEDNKSTASETGSGIPLKSYRSQLAIYNGTFTSASLFSIFLRPFPFLLSPVVRDLWAWYPQEVLLTHHPKTWFIFVCHGMQTVWLSKHLMNYQLHSVTSCP